MNCFILFLIIFVVDNALSDDSAVSEIKVIKTIDKSVSSDDPQIEVPESNNEVKVTKSASITTISSVVSENGESALGQSSSAKPESEVTTTSTSDSLIVPDDVVPSIGSDKLVGKGSITTTNLSMTNVGTMTTLGTIDAQDGNILNNSSGSTMAPLLNNLTTLFSDNSTFTPDIEPEQNASLEIPANISDSAAAINITLGPVNDSVVFEFLPVSPVDLTIMNRNLGSNLTAALVSLNGTVCVKEEEREYINGSQFNTSREVNSSSMACCISAPTITCGLPAMKSSAAAGISKETEEEDMWMVALILFGIFVALCVISLIIVMIYGKKCTQQRRSLDLTRPPQKSTLPVEEPNDQDVEIELKQPLIKKPDSPSPDVQFRPKEGFQDSLLPPEPSRPSTRKDFGVQINLPWIDDSETSSSTTYSERPGRQSQPPSISYSESSRHSPERSDPSTSEVGEPWLISAEPIV